MSVPQTVSAPAPVPVAYLVDDRGQHRPLDYVAQSELMTGWTRARFADTGAYTFVRTDLVQVRASLEFRRYAVTLRFGVTGRLTITTVAQYPETAAQIVCKAERVPRRSVLSVVEVIDQPVN